MDLKTYDLIVILVISQRILSGIGICIESVSECYVLLMGSIAIGISICIGIGIGIAIDIAIWISERMLCGGTRSLPAAPHRLQHRTARLIQNGRRGVEIG